jgi:hypothetical protein
VHRPVVVAETQQQTTMAARVLRIVFYKVTAQNNGPYFAGSNHALEAGHLANSVRQEQ